MDVVEQNEGLVGCGCRMCRFVAVLCGVAQWRGNVYGNAWHKQRAMGVVVKLQEAG